MEGRTGRSGQREEEQVSFRFPVRVLHSTNSWTSRYINKHNFPIMQDMFPGAVLEELDAGHWVHSEQYVPAFYLPVHYFMPRYRPGEFLKTVYRYIR